jgi:hypothetical protein
MGAHAALVVIAVDLLIEALGIERVGGRSDTGHDRQSNEGG